MPANIVAGFCNAGCLSYHIVGISSIGKVLGRPTMKLLQILMSTSEAQSLFTSGDTIV